VNNDFGDLPEDEDFKSGSEKWDIFLDDCVVTLIIEVLALPKPVFLLARFS
jgi:hypothetical protein